MTAIKVYAHSQGHYEVRKDGLRCGWIVNRGDGRWWYTLAPDPGWKADVSHVLHTTDLEARLAGLTP